MTLNQFQVVELVGAMSLCATGASHWFHHEAWCAIFARLTDMGKAGALLNGMLHGAVGAFFVATHPVFVGWASVLTYYGCLLLAKGVLYVVAPAIGLRSMRSPTPEKAKRLRWVGIPMFATGAVVFCRVFVQ